VESFFPYSGMDLMNQQNSLHEQPPDIFCGGRCSSGIAKANKLIELSTFKYLTSCSLAFLCAIVNGSQNGNH